MARKSEPKTVAIIGDLHCGHRVGLTSPSYDARPDTDKTSQRYYNQIARWYPIRRALWREYGKFQRAVGTPDVLIVNGDMVDGAGGKSGGTELIQKDVGIQCDMAVSAINSWGAPKVFMTYGTAYHTGVTRDDEDDIAERCQADIKSHQFLDIEGVTFDVKHHPAAGGNLPHTRKGPVTDMLHNVFWAERELQPKADVFIRSHLHWFGFIGNGDYLGIQMPALQGMGSKFGARRCHGLVDFGMVHFVVHKGEILEWKAHLSIVKEQQATATKV